MAWMAWMAREVRVDRAEQLFDPSTCWSYSKWMILRFSQRRTPIVDCCSSFRAIYMSPRAPCFLWTTSFSSLPFDSNIFIQSLHSFCSEFASDSLSLHSSNMPDKNGQDCLEVSALCPVEASIYGYYPSRPANYFFTVAFGIFLIVQLFQNIKWRSRSYGIAMCFGCLGECIGMKSARALHDEMVIDGHRLCRKDIITRQSIRRDGLQHPNLLLDYRAGPQP